MFLHHAFHNFLRRDIGAHHHLQLGLDNFTGQQDERRTATRNGPHDKGAPERGHSTGRRLGIGKGALQGGIDAKGHGVFRRHTRRRRHSSLPKGGHSLGAGNTGDRTKDSAVDGRIRLHADFDRIKGLTDVTTTDGTQSGGKDVASDGARL